MKFEINDDGGTHTHDALALRTALDSLCQQRDTTLTQVMLRAADDKRGFVITVTSAGFVRLTEEQLFERDTRIAATLAPCVSDAINAAWAANPILENTQRDLDEARAQLAALHAAASAVQTKARALPVSMTEIVHAEEWDDLDRVLADLATAAAEHDAQVREQGIMEGRQEMRDTATVAIEAAKRRGEERDQFAAALAEVRDHARTHGYAALAAALTADLAAQREARIRADERAKALREAAECLREHAASMMQSDLCAGILTAAGMIDARAEVSR